MEAQLSIRQINASTKISVGAIQKLLKQAEALSLSWPLPGDLDDTRLAALFCPEADTQAARGYQEPDWEQVHHELRRKGVTKQFIVDPTVKTEYARV